MKKSTIQLIEKKFEQDILQINIKIRNNKFEINRLAEKQRELKDTRKGLYEILRLIK